MRKRAFWITIIILCLAIITILIVLKIRNSETNIEQEKEITPIEEVTEEQERQTIISLYYTNKETNELMPEARTIDAKELLDNPYELLIGLIIQEPKNDKLESSIPEGTTVNNINLNGDVMEVDLSDEFIQNQEIDEIKVNNSIYAIVNTLTELNEVNFVKILIDGEENVKTDNIDLSEVFERED